MWFVWNLNKSLHSIKLELIYWKAMHRISLKESKSVPLLNQSISVINKMLIKGELSANELCEMCLKRIEKTKQLNAFITITKEKAIKQSFESDKRFKSGQYRYENAFHFI